VCSVFGSPRKQRKYALSQMFECSAMSVSFRFRPARAALPACCRMPHAIEPALVERNVGWDALRRSRFLARVEPSCR